MAYSLPQSALFPRKQRHGWTPHAARELGCWSASANLRVRLRIKRGRQQAYDATATAKS